MIQLPKRLSFFGKRPYVLSDGRVFADKNRAIVEQRDLNAETFVKRLSSCLIYGYYDVRDRSKIRKIIDTPDFRTVVREVLVEMERKGL